MPKYNKVYTSFYNGISQQIPELMHETNCLDMVNCIPDIVNGATKRPPAKIAQRSPYLNLERGMIFHTYDRGEDNEQYMFHMHLGGEWFDIDVSTPDGRTPPITASNEFYNPDRRDEYRDYLTTTDHTDLKAITVQDTTFIINTTKVIGIENSPQEGSTSSSATMTLSGGIIEGERFTPPPGSSGVVHYEATYTVTAKLVIDGTTYTLTSGTESYYGYESTTSSIALTQLTYLSLINSQVPGYSAVASGTNRIIITSSNGESFTSSVAGYSLNVSQGTIISALIIGVGGTAVLEEGKYSAFYWAKRASGDPLHQWRYVVYLDGNTYQAVHHESDTAMELLANSINASGTYKAQRKGSILKIDRSNGREFTFSSWDSWGDQASFGWKGSVAKLTDLPQDLGWDGHVVQITGTDASEFTDYYVKSTGSAWQETRDPFDTRGRFTNMPILLKRQANGGFLVDVADWELPKVGSEETNLTPSFVGSTLTDIFFYKNRLGFATKDNIIMSELGSYFNFYIKTVLSVLDTDPIDITVTSNQATSIEHATAFQGSLFIFTRESQYELTYNGSLTPTTVNVELVSSYPMAIKVRPVVSGDSLYFISMTRRRQQLRRYTKNNDSLVVSGLDLNLTTPTLLEEEIVNILVNEVLGYVICATATFEVYLYNYRDNSGDRVQSAWSRWEFFQGLTEEELIDISIDPTTIQYSMLGSNLLLTFLEAGQGGT